MGSSRIAVGLMKAGVQHINSLSNNSVAYGPVSWLTKGTLFVFAVRPRPSQMALCEGM